MLALPPGFSGLVQYPVKTLAKFDEFGLKFHTFCIIWVQQIKLSEVTHGAATVTPLRDVVFGGVVLHSVTLMSFQYPSNELKGV